MGAALESPEDRAAREAEAKEQDDAKKAGAKLNAVAWYNKILAVAAPCDKASGALQEQFANFGNGSNLLSIYRTASFSKDACSNSWQAYGDIDVPGSFADDIEELAEKAQDTCSNAYFAKRQFSEAAMEIADGDMRPSILEEARQYAEAGSAGTLLCVSQAMAAVNKAGVELEELSGDGSLE